MMNGFRVFCQTFRVNFRQYLLYSFGVCLSVTTVLTVGTFTRLAFQNVERELDAVVLDGAQVQLPTVSAEVAADAVADAATLLAQKPMAVSVASATAEDQPVSLWGVDACGDKRLSLSWTEGRFFSRLEQDGAERVCAISKDTAIALFGTASVIGCPIRLTLGRIREPFRIVGVYDRGYMARLVDQPTKTVYIPSTVMAQWQAADYRPSYWVRREEGTDEFLTFLQDRLGKPSVGIEDYSEQREQIVDIFQKVETVLSLISGVSLVVAAFNLLVITRIHVGGRVREIGLKKSLGAGDADVMWEFVMESAATALIGAALGVAIDGVLCAILTWSGSPVGFRVVRAAVVTGIVLALSVVFSAIPSFRASRLPPADTLRREN